MSDTTDASPPFEQQPPYEPMRRAPYPVDAYLSWPAPTDLANVETELVRIRELLETLTEQWKQPILIVNTTVGGDAQRLADELQEILRERKTAS